MDWDVVLPVGAAATRFPVFIRRGQSAETGNADINISRGQGDVTLKDDFLGLVMIAKYGEAFI